MSGVWLRPLPALMIALAGASAAGAATCNVQSGGIAFGEYDTLSASALDGVGSVVVGCDADTPFTVALGPGSGSFDRRTLVSGGSTIDYNLYTDATRSLIWGDGISAPDVSASGTSVSVPIYGRIPARQNVEAGSYGDSIAITVSY